jgi:hypothetical protein
MKKALFLLPLALFLGLFLSISPINAATVVPSPSPEISAEDLFEQVMAINAVLEDTDDTSLAIGLAEKRQELMVDLGKKDARLFLQAVIPADVRSRFPSKVQAFIERRETVRGKLEVLHIDDFENNEEARFDYTLIANNKRHQVVSPVELTPQGPGTVNATGYIVKEIIALDGGDGSIIPVAGQEGMNGVGEQRVLVLITETIGDTSPLTIAQVEEAVFGQNEPFAQYYRAQSYDKVRFTGKVYKISLARKGDYNSCGYGIHLTDEDVIKAIKDQNIDLHQYDRVLFVPNVGYCSGVGKWERIINGEKYLLSQSWVSWGNIQYGITSGIVSHTLAHEIGHALGVLHANSLECTSTGSCEHVEYGNYFDMMGFGTGSFNALYKEQLKWLLPEDFLTISSSGDYEMKSIESTSGYRAAKVINPHLGPLSVMYLERRMNATTFWNTNVVYPQRKGLLLNVPEQSFNLSKSAVELIDMKEGIDPVTGEERVALMAGDQPFLMKDAGVTFGSVNTEGDKIKFNVKIDKVSCSTKPPLILPQDETPKIVPGRSVYIYVNARNDDPLCSPPAGFVLQVDELPSGWSLRTQSSQQDNIGRNSTAYFYADVQVPTTETLGKKEIGFIVRNTTSGLSARGKVYVEVRDIPKIISLSKTEVAPGDKVLVTTNLSFNDKQTLTAYGKDSINFGNNFYGPQYEITIPATLTAENSFCNQSWVCPRPVKSGTYTMELHSNGAGSESYRFTINTGDVPSISIAPSSLKLVKNDAGREVSLDATIPISITGSNQELRISKTKSSVTFRRKEQANYYYGYSGVELAPGPENSAITPVTSESGDQVYIIPAKTTLKFIATKKVMTQSLEGGTYTAALADLVFTDSSDKQIVFSIPENKTNEQTILGDTTPRITSIVKPMNECGQVTIKGVRFHPTDNTIKVLDTGWGTVALIDKISSIGGTQIYFIPIQSEIGPGKYFVSVENTGAGVNAGWSYFHEIVVPSRTYAGPCPSPTVSPRPLPAKTTVTISPALLPTLALSLDPNGNESLLTFTRKITIRAEENITLIRENGGMAEFENTTKESIPNWGKERGNYSLKSLTPNVTLSKNSYGQDIYEIKKGTTASFEATATINPQLIPPGAYVASLKDVIVFKDNNPSWITLPPNKSNIVTIIGEKSPYITEITHPVDVCNEIVIRGARFDETYNTLNIYPIEKGKDVITFSQMQSESNGTVIRFVPSDKGLNSGQYLISVTNTELGDRAGLSNQKYLVVEGDIKTCQPSVLAPVKDVVVDSISPSSPQAGDRVTLRGRGFSEKNKITLVHTKENSTNVFYDITSGSKGNTLSFVIPTSLKSGLYRLEIDNGLGKINTAFTFTVQGTAESTPRIQSGGGGGTPAPTSQPSGSSSPAPEAMGTPQNLFANAFYALGDFLDMLFAKR